MRIDLHTHSTCSDGTDTPTALIRKAAEVGLDVVALTDHDTTAGWDEAEAEAREQGIRLVKGIELSTSNGEQSQHLLAYQVDPTDPALMDMLERGRVSREQRVPRAIAQLSAAGVEIDESQVRAAAGGTIIGRPHLADAIVKAGQAESRQAAFALFLVKGGAGYVERDKPTIEDAIGIVRDAGGVTVVAHPRARGSVFTKDRFAELQTLGLLGIEVDHQEHDRATRAELRQIAAELEMVATGSSDYHGSRKQDHDLGCNLTTEDAYERLLGSRPVARDKGAVPAANAAPTLGDLAQGFDKLRPMPQLLVLVSAVAKRASLTAEPDTPAYVGVRPAAHGVIAGYVNKSFLDLRLTPERAKQLALSTGWRLYSSNSYTGTLRVPAQSLDDPAVLGRVVELFVEALNKSSAGPPFEGGHESAKSYTTQQPICPTHETEMLGGVCDRCE